MAKIDKILISVYMETEKGVYEKEFTSIAEAGKYAEEVTKEVYGIAEK